MFRLIFFKDQINEGIKSIAENYVKTEIEFKDLDISFFNHFPKLTVTLTDSSIKGSKLYQTENLISAKEIALGVDVKTLFDDKIIFNELFITDATINLKIDSLGRNNFDIVKPSDEVEKEEESSVGLALNNFKIANSNFLYDDQSSKTYLKLDQFDYDGLIDFTENQLTLNAKTDIKNVNFSFDEQKYVKNLPLKGKINSKIDLNNLSFYFTENNLELGQFPFSLKGSLLMPNESKVFDLTISSEKNDDSIYGTWISKRKDLPVLSRKFSLKKTTFNYDPKNVLIQPKYGVDEEYADEYDNVDWVNSKKKKYDESDGEEYFVDVQRAASDEIYKINGSTQKLTEKQLKNLHKLDLEIIRNTIYARHGYSFANRGARQFFDYVDWYVPLYTNVEDKLSPIEKDNIELLKRFEKYATDNYQQYGR